MGVDGARQEARLPLLLILVPTAGGLLCCTHRLLLLARFGAPGSARLAPCTTPPRLPPGLPLPTLFSMTWYHSRRRSERGVFCLPGWQYRM